MGLRLLADDLTGALDSAAAFVPLFGPVRISYGANAGTELNAAHDSGTREADADDAARRVARLGHFLAPETGGIRFFKVDSLLRGHAGVELAALLSVHSFSHVIIAPALPFQGRITRGGRQCIRSGGTWLATGEDIGATLTRLGHVVQRRQPGEACPAGISLWDADSDEHLHRIQSSVDDAGTVLWVGTAGLSAAILRQRGVQSAAPLCPAGPMLALVGTDHPVMLRQLAVSGLPHHRLTNDSSETARIAAGLRGRALVLVTCDLETETARNVAQATIASRFAALCRSLPRPGSLFISGGETLSGLCSALKTEALELIGQFETGAPVSRMIGGHWPAIPVVSKSGAFGTDDFLSRLHSSLGETTI